MIGISTFAYDDLSLQDALSLIEDQAECAEIFSEGLHDLLQMADVVFSYDLHYTVHAPSMDINISSIGNLSDVHV